ncbi:sensor domain-containing protein [Streptomyces catenulae]|uniref:Sensor domain-containing protein n=1 Tax=Streptomyces catenulae TaxID=66875 RepID=A0ABV2Z0M6_9ACTN|nr:sensor domain-containing protein [Streptomyces catenulae]
MTMATASERRADAPRALLALRAPFSGRTWRAFLYLLGNLPVAVALFAYATTMVSLSVGLLVTVAGIPVFAATLAGARGLGAMERARARVLLGTAVASPPPVRPSGAGVVRWTGALLRNGASWRQLLFCLLRFPWAVAAFSVVLTYWLLAWSLLTYPLWQWTFPRYLGQPGIQLWEPGAVPGDLSGYLDTPAEIAVTALVGLLLVLALPWVTYALTAPDRALIRVLLGPWPPTATGSGPVVAGAEAPAPYGGAPETVRTAAPGDGPVPREG